MKIFIGAAAVIAVIALAGLGLLYATNAPATSSGAPESIAIGTPLLESTGLLHIAEDQGFFEDNGLNVSIRIYDTGMAATNGMLKGEVDLAVPAEFALVGKALGQEKIKAVGSIDKGEYIYLVGRKDRGIANITGLKGKKVGLPRGTVSEFYLSRALSLRGVNPWDVTLVNMNRSQSEEVLLNGNVDAIVSTQPYVGSIESRLGGNAVQLPVQNNQYTYAVVLGTDDWITKNPELVDRFLRAMVAAEIFTSAQPAVAKDIIQKHLHYDDEYMETAWAANQYSLSLDQSLITAMEDEGRWMIRNNLTNVTTIPDYRDYIYKKGLEAVKPESINIP
jgi:NitT/TauT family transport system substrate-binding protein